MATQDISFLTKRLIEKLQYYVFEIIFFFLSQNVNFYFKKKKEIVDSSNPLDINCQVYLPTI